MWIEDNENSTMGRRSNGFSQTAFSCFSSLHFLAVAAWAAGEQDDAIRLVQEADAIGDPALIAGKYWPDFTELRADPRFQEILRRRGWT